MSIDDSRLMMRLRLLRAVFAADPRRAGLQAAFGPAARRREREWERHVAREAQCVCTDANRCGDEWNCDHCADNGQCRFDDECFNSPGGCCPELCPTGVQQAGRAKGTAWPPAFFGSGKSERTDLSTSEPFEGLGR